MINFFYAYGLLWIIILILYLFGWSDLCFTLNGNLTWFILIMITLSFLSGFIFRKKLKFKRIEENPHKKSTITFIFLIFHILNFIYMGYIPLIQVLSGISIKSLTMEGIPILGNFIVWGSIFYSFYLSYLFICFKKKKTLLENITVIFMLLLYVGRQNVLICILMFINLLIAEYLSRKRLLKNKRKIPLIIASMLIILYLFGVMGNSRYGNSWKWNDSSMIFKAGYKNEKFPKFIPGEYFWSYIYLVSPLSNLNYNVSKYDPNLNIEKYTYEYLPDFIRTKLTNYKPIEIALPSKSLTVGTAYVNPYLTFGMLGMYIFLIFQFLLCMLILFLDDKIKKKSKNSVTIYCILLYFLAGSFFSNTLTYSITSFGIIIAFLLSIGILDIGSIIRKSNKYGNN